MTRGAFLLALGAAGCAALRPAPRAEDVLNAPLELEVQELGGARVDLGAKRGKVLLLDFFATWCAPCARSIPEIEKYFETYAPRGLEVYGISVDQDVRKIAPYAQSLGVRHPILWDKGGESFATLGLAALPAAVVVDQSGVIRAVVSGTGRYAALEELIPKLLAP